MEQQASDTPSTSRGLKMLGLGSILPACAEAPVQVSPTARSSLLAGQGHLPF